MASIRQRGNFWEARVRLRGFEQSRSFNTKNDARGWATVVESEIERGIFTDRSEIEKYTLGDLLQRYLKEVSCHKKSAAAERYRIDFLLRQDIAKLKVTALSGKVMAQWRDQRLMKASGSTTNRDLNLLSHLMTVARKEWSMPVENPVTMIRRPPENKSRKRRLAPDEEARLLAALEVPERGEDGRFAGPQNIWLKPLVSLALETAMRRSELLALRWADIDFNERFARLHDTKNGDSRDVPLSSRVMTQRNLLNSRC